MTALAALALLGIPWGWWALGPTGALGIAAGIALVAMSYSVSNLVIAWADSVHRALILPCGLMTYVVKFSAIIAIFVGLDERAWPGKTPLGLAVIVAAVVWSASQIGWVMKRGPHSPQ